MALVASGGSAGSTTRKSPRTRGRVVEDKPTYATQRRSTPSTSTSTSTRSTSSGGGGGGGGTTSRSVPVSSPAPAAPAPAPAPDPGPTAAERQAERRARQAEQARQRQLEEMRAAIEALPLDPNIVAAFAERGRLAQRGVQEAQAFGQRARGQSDVDFDQFIRQLGQQTDTAVGGLRQEAASRNLAFQPAFVGVGMRDIRDEAQESRALAEQQRAQFLAGIQRQVEQARAARESEVAAIARDRARAQADHRAFIDAQLAALGQ